MTEKMKIVRITVNRNNKTINCDITVITLFILG